MAEDSMSKSEKDSLPPTEPVRSESLPKLGVPVSDLTKTRREHNKRRREPLVGNGVAEEALLRDQEDHEHLERSDVPLTPEDFELYEGILMENMGFTPDEAQRYIQKYEKAYYNGDPTSKDFVISSIRNAFDFFAASSEEPEL